MAELTDYEIVEKAVEERNIHPREGSTGVKNLNELSKMLGYCNLDAFIADNTSVQELIHIWIAEHMDDNWRDSLLSYLPEEESDEDSDDNDPDNDG